MSGTFEPPENREPEDEFPLRLPQLANESKRAQMNNIRFMMIDKMLTIMVKPMKCFATKCKVPKSRQKNQGQNRVIYCGLAN